jgi:hypothetical protein
VVPGLAWGDSEIATKVRRWIDKTLKGKRGIDASCGDANLAFSGLNYRALSSTRLPGGT